MDGSSARFESLKVKDLAMLKLLLELRCVSKAADVIGMSQPAMSRWFGRIRDCFQDPLLVRTKNELILTTTAEMFLSHLEQLEPLLLNLVPKEFDPTSNDIEYSIAAPDYVFENVFTDILPELLRDDYLVRFRFLPWTPLTKNELVQGNIHLAVSMDNVFPPNVYHRIIDTDHLVCIARKQHPICKKNVINIDDLLRYHHVIPETGGGWVNRIRKQMESYGTFRPKVVTSSYNVAFALAGATDLITIAPNHVVCNSPILRTLSVREVHLSETAMEYGLFWHEKYQTDPSHVWLRQKLFPLVCSHKKQLSRVA